MDIIDLFKIFVRVTETGSFTRAAETLGMPRSTLSVAIQELESRLDTRLLHRTTRKVTPTPDGRALYERCLDLIADTDEIENLFRARAAKPIGLLRVNVPGRVGRRIIAPALPDFLALYPDIDIDLEVTDRTINLIEDNIDCVLRVGALDDSSLVARVICDLHFVNVASPHYLERWGVPRKPGDLAEHHAISYASPSNRRVEDWEWLENGRLHHLKMRGRVTVNNAEAYIACCLAGLGLIQIPAYDVRRHLAAGQLIEVMPDYRAMPAPLTLLYPHRHHLSRRLQVFAEWADKILKAAVTE